MAYSSMVGGLLFPILVIVNPDISDISMAFYTFVSAVVGAYVGFATLDDANVMKHETGEKE
ncbi:MAG TPA: hypothetical protein VJ184_13075 [Chryseolinea sp.]|nr:hypothetical protein [Chryseolinea sp.]